MLNNKGQSLLEVIVALAIFALISAVMVTLSIGGFVTLDVGGQQTEAQALAQEGMEAVRAIRDRAWNELIFTTSSVSTSSGQWVFNGEGTNSQSGNYLRTISVTSVCRDLNNNIATCPAFYTDVQTKKIISKVEWPVRNTTNTVQQVSYLTNWDTNLWMQTDWFGGTGQNIWSNVTKYFADDGNVDASTTDQLQLKYNPGGGCGQMVWDFNNQYQYTYDQNEIEVIGGLGQLKDLGTCSGATSTCTNLTNQSSCQTQASCSWIQSYSGTIPSIRNNNSYTPNQISYWSGFSETSTKNGGEVYYQLSNDGGVSWKYWNGSAWVTSTMATNYNISTVINTNINIFPTSTKKIMFKAFLSGNGTEQVQLDQVQIDCSRNNEWDFFVPENYLYNTSTIEITSGTAQLVNLSSGYCSGTEVGCETYDSEISCGLAESCSWNNGISFATTSPSLNPAEFLAVPTTTFYKWTHFIETANKNGGDIYYQLSNNDGSIWQYWNGSAWVVAGTGNYNTATVIDTNIITFSTSTGKLMFKAFLKSNGTQLVQLNNVQIWWQELTGANNYATLGSIISSAFNLLNPSPVSVISWTSDTSTCSNCAVKLQVRTAPNNAGSPGIWSAWYGLNGVGDYFTDYHGSLIPKVLNWNQWVQYQAFLIGDGNSTPILNDVTIYYK